MECAQRPPVCRNPRPRSARFALCGVSRARVATDLEEEEKNLCVCSINGYFCSTDAGNPNRGFSERITSKRFADCGQVELNVSSCALSEILAAVRSDGDSEYSRWKFCVLSSYHFQCNSCSEYSAG